MSGRLDRRRLVGVYPAFDFVHGHPWSRTANPFAAIRLQPPESKSCVV